MSIHNKSLTMKYILITLLVLYIGGTSISFSSNKDHDHIWVITVKDTLEVEKPDLYGGRNAFPIDYPKYDSKGCTIVCILCKEKNNQFINWK